MKAAAVKGAVTSEFLFGRQVGTPQRRGGSHRPTSRSAASGLGGPLSRRQTDMRDEDTKPRDQHAAGRGLRHGLAASALACPFAHGHIEPHHEPDAGAGRVAMSAHRAHGPSHMPARIHLPDRHRVSGRAAEPLEQRSGDAVQRGVADQRVQRQRHWEQGKRLPEGPAKALLRILDEAPEIALAALD